jgi:uncharacterized protein (TIGR00288 family)
MIDIAQSRGASNDRVALFIDVDNVLILSQNSGLPFYLSLIIDRVRQQGTIMSSKAYADWTSSLLRPFLGDFRVSAVELVQLPTSMAAKEHKNTADIQLAVDALEMVFLPGCPDTVVIVGGDRDYVPLVQKLKRYGVFVMGIGVEAGVSGVLIEACDSFVYYDDILPPAPEEIAEPVSLPDPVDAYSLMQRSVEALGRDGRASTGASVHTMMKQLAPDFDLVRYKTTLKALAQDAQKEGYIGLTENPGSDFILTAGPSPNTLALTVAESAKREYDYSTRDTITSSYRTILQEHRIPLLPWNIREKFVRLIWESLERRDYGMSLDAMRGTLLDYANENNLPVSPQMVQKLLYTLNFARCFNSHKNASTGYSIPIPLEIYSPVYPVFGVDEAINQLHRRYLEILAGDVAVLDPDAAFDLLYGNEITDEQEREERRQDLDEMCCDNKQEI